MLEIKEEELDKILPSDGPSINEVKRFIKLKIKKNNSVNKAIGINEIKEFLNDEKELSDIKEKISK